MEPASIKFFDVRRLLLFREGMRKMTEKAMDWEGAYASEIFKKAKGNRLRFVIPLLGVFTALFVGLFTLQSYWKDIGQIPVAGYVDVGFVAVMALFPLTGVFGVIFMKYTEKYVYPYEDAMLRTYAGARKSADESSAALPHESKSLEVAVNS